MRIGCGYLFFKEKIFSGAPRGYWGAPKVTKMMGSIFFQNVNCLSNALGFFGMESWG